MNDGPGLYVVALCSMSSAWHTVSVSYGVQGGSGFCTLVVWFSRQAVRLAASTVNAAMREHSNRLSFSSSSAILLVHLPTTSWVLSTW